MTYKLQVAQQVADETFQPSVGCRFKVEAAMLSMIEELKRQGLGVAEIALSLADAAEEYVLRLANCADEAEDVMRSKPSGH